MFRIKELRTKLENWMMAVAFAEAGEHKAALELIRPQSQNKRKKRMGKNIPKRVDNRPRLEC